MLRYTFDKILCLWLSFKLESNLHQCHFVSNE